MPPEKNKKNNQFELYKFCFSKIPVTYNFVSSVFIVIPMLMLGARVLLLLFSFVSYPLSTFRMKNAFYISGWKICSLFSWEYMMQALSAPHS